MPAASTGAPWTGGGAVVRTTGKVFFSLGVDDYVCSGSAVDAPDRSTVLTAGHCAVDPEVGVDATNWVFVPAYADGRAPYGLFPATHLATTDGWRTQQDFDVDLAFADVARNAAGRLLQDAVGAQPIAFSAPRGRPAAASATRRHRRGRASGWWRAPERCAPTRRRRRRPTRVWRAR